MKQKDTAHEHQEENFAMKNFSKVLGSSFAKLLYSLLLCFPVMAYGATYTLPAALGTTPFTSCKLTSGTTYTCSNGVTIPDSSVIVLTSSIILNFPSGANLRIGNSVTINSPSSGYTLQITSGEDVNIGNSFTGILSITTTNNQNISIGSSVNITGNLTSNGQLSIQGGTVNGVCTPTNTHCTGGGAGLDHIEIDSSSASGLTCAANLLTIKACANSACTSLYTSGLTGTLSANTASGSPTVYWATSTNGATGATFNTGSSGTDTKNVQVYSTAASSVTFGVSSTSSTPTTATPTCVFGGTSSCVYTANTAGFVFTNGDTSSTAFTLPQVAGIASPTPTSTSTNGMYLRALQTSSTNPAVCTPAIISSTVSVNLSYSCVNPGSCQGGSLATVTGVGTGATSATLPTTAGAASSSTAAVSLVFDANGSAPLTFTYNDVGQVTLSASRQASTPPVTGGTAPTLTGTSSAFVVAPHHFAITSYPANSNSNGTPVTKAGNVFTAIVTSMNGLGTPTATANFGKETKSEGATLSFTACQPTGTGAAPTLAGAGALTGFSGGAVTDSSLSYSEVGNLDLTANLTSGSYLNSGLTAHGTTATTPGAAYTNTCNATDTNSGSTTNGNVGRFIPDHFETAIAPTTAGTLARTPPPIGCPVGLTCPTTPNNNSAAGSFSGMVYSGQPFTVQVTAKNAAGAVTKNYTASYFSKNVTLAPYTSVGGATATPISVGTYSGGSSVASTAFSNGIGTNINPTFTFANTPTKPTDIFIRATDPDGVTSLLSPATSSIESGVKVASGRIFIPNVYGTDKLPLPLPIFVQYYSGSYWTTSLTDSSTVSFNSALSTSGGNVTSSASPNCISINSPSTASVTSGLRTLSLSANTTNCSSNISINNAPSYLPIYPSNGGLVTFGVYKNKSPTIYMRENY